MVQCRLEIPNLMKHSSWAAMEWQPLEQAFSSQLVAICSAWVTRRRVELLLGSEGRVAIPVPEFVKRARPLTVCGPLGGVGEKTFEEEHGASTIQVRKSKRFCCRVGARSWARDWWLFQLDGLSKALLAASSGTVTALADAAVDLDSMSRRQPTGARWHCGLAAAPCMLLGPSQSCGGLSLLIGGMLSASAVAIRFAAGESEALTLPSQILACSGMLMTF